MPQAARSGVLRAVFGAALGLTLGGCSADSADPDPGTTGGDPAGTVSCEHDPRVDAYQDLAKTGDLGVLSFQLAQAEPAPPARGNNTFHLDITDASGAPVAGALEVELKMPDHGHGTSVQPKVSFDPATSEWTVDPLYLFMPGVWRIQLEAFDGAAAAGATPLDRTALFFCIEG
jgi:hypothetical protein